MVLDHVLALEVKLNLATFILIDNDDVVDGMYQALSRSGTFTIKYAYESQLELMENGDAGLWKRIWQLDIPQQARAFLWLTSHEKFMCNQQHARIGFLTNPKCPFCPQHDESVPHVVRDCYKASAIQRALIRVDEFNKQCHYPIKDLILINIRNSHKNFEGRWLSMMFAITVWWLWKWR